MSEIKIQKAFKVALWEHERGWGSRIDEVKYFDSETEAKEFCQQFNSKNTDKVVPDWYMRAEYCGEVK